MKGTVTAVDGERVSALAAHGTTRLTVIGTHLTEVGDVLCGELNALGAERLLNETRGETLDVFIEDCPLPRDDDPGLLEQG